MAGSPGRSPNRVTLPTIVGLLRTGRGGITIAAVLSLICFSAILAFSSSSSSPTLYDVSRSARSKLNIAGVKDNLGHIFNDTLGVSTAAYFSGTLAKHKSGIVPEGLHY